MSIIRALLNRYAGSIQLYFTMEGRPDHHSSSHVRGLALPDFKDVAFISRYQYEDGLSYSESFRDKPCRIPVYYTEGPRPVARREMKKYDNPIIVTDKKGKEQIKVIGEVELCFRTIDKHPDRLLVGKFLVTEDREPGFTLGFGSGWEAESLPGHPPYPMGEKEWQLEGRFRRF